MVVLVALTAAMYAAVLIPFKLFPVIPGITEVRPANVFPVICSLMFGPAGAWGAAFGNLIGDLMGGTYGLGSYFGMVGNFWFGYIPYRVWRTLSKRDPVVSGLVVVDIFRKGRSKDLGHRVLLLAIYLPITLLASLACGITIGWGLDILGIVPFHILAPAITINNFLAAGLLGPLLLPLLYPRVKRWGLLYTDVMDSEDLYNGRLPHLAHVLLWIALVGSLIIGISMSLGVTGSETFSIPLPGGNEVAFSLSSLPQWGMGVGLGIAPFMAILIIGCLLI